MKRQEQGGEGRLRKPVTVPRRPTTLPVRPQNVDNQSDVPQISATVAGSTCTMTMNSSSGEATTTATGVKTAEGPTHPENFQYFRKSNEKKSRTGTTKPSHYIICTNRDGRGPD